MTRKVAGCPFFCHPEALAEGSPKGILPLRFAQGQNEGKAEEILHSANAQFRMTEVEVQNDRRSIRSGWLKKGSGWLKKGSGWLKKGSEWLEERSGWLKRGSR